MDHTHHMAHNAMDHNHSMHDHMAMNHSAMDHGSMGHGTTMDPNMDHSAHAAMDHSAHGSHGMMMMAFHFGYEETILFEQWKIDSVTGLIASVVGIVIMAALYEGLKYYREYLFWKTYNTLQYRSVTVPPGKNVVNEDNQVVQPTMFSWIHAFQTLLHIVQIILSYFLMLIFMTYNVWLCLGVVLGAAIGYFLFGWKKSVVVDVTEHCH